MLLRQRRFRGSGGGAPPPDPTALWSVVYAAAGVGDDILVDQPVVYDLTTAVVYGNIDITSDLVVDVTKNTAISFDSMMVMAGGSYICGTEASPFPATFTHSIMPVGARSLEAPLNLSDPQHAGNTANRGIMWMPGASRSWVAEVPARVITKLAATANAGATSISLKDAVTWKAGWQFELTTTKYLTEGVGRERCTVAADVNNSTTVTLTAPLAYRHHGQLQYIVPPAYEDVADTNLSYTQRTIVSGDSFGTVNGNAITGARVLATMAASGQNTTVDNRASVGLLTHPIKFFGPNDSDWTNHGYGATDMVMGLSNKSMMRGVEMYRVGKAGQLGAYPIHHHMRSYTRYGVVGSGAELGDVDSLYNYNEFSSVRDSSNRGVSIHGTNGHRLSSVVFSNIDTHCVFFEDHSERRNIVEDCLVSGVNAIGYGKTAIKTHDVSNTGQGPAGFWASSPDNRIRRNQVFGAFVGYWNAFTKRYFACYKERGTRTGTGTITFTNVADAGPLSTLVPDTVTLTAINSTTFSRNSVAYGSLANVTVGVQASHGPNSGAFVGGPVWQYKIASGGTAFVTGDTFIFDCTKLKGCVGQSRDVDYQPWLAVPLEHVDNEAACCRLRGMVTGFGAFQENGDLQNTFNIAAGYQYGNDNNSGVELDAAPKKFFTRMNIWKSEVGWYENVAVQPQYDNWKCFGLSASFETSLHNQHLGLFGNTWGGQFNGMHCGAHTLDDYYVNDKPTLQLSYGNSLTRVNSIFIGAEIQNFSRAGEEAMLHEGGVMVPWDFYVFSVYGKADFYYKDYNNSVLGANPGVYGIHMPPMFLYGQFGTAYTDIFNPATIGGGWNGTKGDAIFRLPPDGSMFGQGGWWVFDSPFHLYGTTGAVYADSGAAYPNLNGKIVPDTYHYYGISVEEASGVSVKAGLAGGVGAAINYTRLQSDFSTPVTDGTWNTPKSTSGHAYPNMRHAALLDGGCAKIGWPNRTDVPLPTSLKIQVMGAGNDNAPSTAHVFLAVDWNPATAISSAQVRIEYGANTLDVDYHVLASVASKAALTGSSVGSYWKDATNSLLWLHVITGDLTGASTSSAFGKIFNILINS